MRVVSLGNPPEPSLPSCQRPASEADQTRGGAMTTGVAIPGGSGPLSIRNLLCGGDVHGNALGRWSMLALPELPACCLVICLSHTATGRFLLRMSGARTDEPGVKRRGLRAGGLIGLAVGGKQGCDRRRHLVVGRGHDTRRLGRRGRSGRA